MARGVEKPVADAILEYSMNYRTEPEDGQKQGYRIVVLRTEQTSHPQLPVRGVCILGARLLQCRRFRRLRAGKIV